MSTDVGGHAHFGSEAAALAAAYGCERAVLEFSAGFDLREIDRMTRHFAEDGVWKRHDGDIHGPRGLQAFMEARPAALLVRHVLSNIRVTFSTASDAVAESYVTVYRHDDPVRPGQPAPLAGPNVVGRYTDRLVLHAGCWKLARREVGIDFKQQTEHQS